MEAQGNVERTGSEDNMPIPAMPRLLDALEPRVTAFQTHAFSLSEDLDWLDRLRGLQAPVGVILYSSRILEVLARQAGILVGLAAVDDGLHDCLRKLLAYQNLSKDAYRLLDR